MKLIHTIVDRLVRRQYARIERDLRQARPERLRRRSEAQALRVFRRAARRVPAYREILRQAGVDPRAVRTIDEFRRHVPIVDKHSLFTRHEIGELCVDGQLDDAAGVCTSSGSTGEYSFGVERRGQVARNALALEFLLNVWFGVLDRPTLLINALPMGVKVPSRHLAVADTGTRPDAVWALVSKLSRHFEQFILVAEHPLLKKLIDEGPDHGVTWRDQRVHAITGGEYIAEPFRRYVADRLRGDRPDGAAGRIGINFGLSELSLSIGCELPGCPELRREVWSDPSLLDQLTDRPRPVCPAILQYNPATVFLETVLAPNGREELVVTVLDPRARLPMVRYNTHDDAALPPPERVEPLADRARRDAHLSPIRLPYLLLWGKLEPLRASAGKIYPEQVKDALYDTQPLAEAATGNFVLREQDGCTSLTVQLRQTHPPRPDVRAELARRIAADTGSDVEVHLAAYEDFRRGMDHDFQRKNRYIDSPDPAIGRPGSDGPARPEAPDPEPLAWRTP
jgi:phenylacetate-CoA ligase